MSFTSFANDRKPYALFTFPEDREIIYVDAINEGKQRNEDPLNPLMLRVFQGQPGQLTELAVKEVKQYRGSGWVIYLSNGTVVKKLTSSGQIFHKILVAKGIEIGLQKHDVSEENLKLYGINRVDPTKVLKIVTKPVEKVATVANKTKSNEQSKAANKEHISFEPIKKNDKPSAPTGKEITTPFVYKAVNPETKEEETFGGVLAADHVSQKPNALQILRHELNRQAMETSEKAQKDGVFLSTTKRFPLESLTFFIAIGGVTFASAWNSSHGDPLAMERHILSLKDPIAHLSFYTFMLSQGIYIDFRTKGLSPQIKARMMTRLNYQGMAVGSFVSSLVTDITNSTKMCVDKWLHGKTDDESLISCDQAWVEWTTRNKFTQYVPQILHLWTSQWAAERTQSLLNGTINKITETSFIQKILNKEYLTNLACKITATDIGIMFGPGGLIVKSIKFLGHLTQLTLFVAIDHAIMNHTYRAYNNLVQPMLFDFDVKAINDLWYSADAADWEGNRMNQESTLEFEKEIDNFGIRMQRWREHLNGDAEVLLASWLEMTKELLNQMDYANRYYETFASSLYKTLNTYHKVQKKELTEDEYKNKISRFPLRTLPFYGVSLDSIEKVGGVSNEDYQLTKPSEVETIQKNLVVRVAYQHRGIADDLKIQKEQDLLRSIISKLVAADDIKKMVEGLTEFRKIYRMLDQYVYSPEMSEKIRFLQKQLGNPEPIIYPLAGFSRIFSEYSTHAEIAKSADFRLWSVEKSYRFFNEGDLMMYKLICGDSEANIIKTEVKGVSILAPQFSPPHLLIPINYRNHFCSQNFIMSNKWDSTKTAIKLYSTKIADLTLNEYIVRYLNYNAIGNYQADYDQNNFMRWWEKTAVDPVNHEFRYYDEQYKKVFEMAHANFFNERGAVKKTLDLVNQSKYLPKSLEESIKFEISLYTQILSRILTNDEVTTLKTNTNFVEQALLNSQQNGFSSIYKHVPGEIIKLNTLLIKYMNFVNKSKELDLKQYEKHSDLIRTTLNNISVLFGLKKIVGNGSKPVEDQPEDLLAPAEPLSDVTSTAKMQPFFEKNYLADVPNAEADYEDIELSEPSFKQRMAIAAIRGLKRVTADVNRFIMMRISLRSTLEMDKKNAWKQFGVPTGVNPKRAGPVGR